VRRTPKQPSPHHVGWRWLVAAQMAATLLTLLNLTTKVALMVTALVMLETLASVTTGFTPLVMRLGNVFGKTHNHRKVHKCTDYHCSTSPGVICVIVFIFSQGRHYNKDVR
jgi:hypothetical protein